MTKKEVIFFDAGAYGPYVKCELINGQLESEYGDFHGDKMLDLKVKSNEVKIISFWKKMDEINVWNWNKTYNDEMAITDGFTWEIKLRNRDGKSKYSSGYEKYPRNYKKFITAINKLFEIKIDFWD